MKKLLFVLSLAGSAFSGYISGVKFFAQTCAFGETCPNFLGSPACYYGFGLFLLLTIITLMLFFVHRKKRIVRALVWTSGVGFLFSGFYAAPELPLLLANGFSAYTFGMPTCVLGFLFFTAIFILSVSSRKKLVR